MTTRTPLYVDLDNVISDTDPLVRSLIKKHIGIDRPRKAVTCFDYYKALNYPKKDEKPVWEEFFKDGISRTKPIPGAIGALERLALFCQIEILTSRKKDKKVEKLTKEWLATHKIPFDKVAVVSETEKIEVVLSSPESLLIDDRRRTIAELTKKGGSAVLFDNPWNKGFSHKNAKRLANWKQIYSFIIKHPTYKTQLDHILIRLLKKARKALRHSYAPYSGFRVGASLMMTDGRCFDGCNVECVSFSPTICAERTSIVKAVSAGYKPGDFFAIAITAKNSNGHFGKPTPCGVCRQMLSEFSDSDFPIIVATSADEIDLTVRTSADYLPFSFSSY